MMELKDSRKQASSSPFLLSFSHSSGESQVPGHHCKSPWCLTSAQSYGKLKATHQGGEGVLLILLLQEDENVRHQENQDICKGEGREGDNGRL